MGGGPAALTAAIYASRSGNRTLLLEAGLPGGMVRRRCFQPIVILKDIRRQR